jgi:CBS domain containing-hemolysin-like protein
MRTDMSRWLKLRFSTEPPGSRRRTCGTLLALLLLFPLQANAALFEGEALDTVADVMSWVVLVIAPVIAIAVFWMVHIMPEKIAEQRQHPQAKAIQTLCLLSLAFGGLLWPLAWLWAYSKPVLYKMAYGTDVAPHDDAEGDTLDNNQTQNASGRVDEATELQLLRERLNQLEARLSHSSAAE